MSVFKFNYNKEGKGIEKDAPEKNIFYTFFESFIRNFWNLIKVNFLYVATSVPMLLIAAFLFAGLVYPNMGEALSNLAASSGAEDTLQTEALYVGAFMMVFASEVLLLIGSGPSSAYFSYATKCMTNEEHVWLWGDFKKQFKENFKQATAVAVIDVIVLVSAIVALVFYSGMYGATGNAVYFALRTVMIVVSLLYCMMHGYIYQFMVTFENKLSVIYKNAFIMAIAKLPQNLLLLAVQVVPTYLLFTIINPFPAALLLLVIWYALLRYPMEFYAARSIKKIIKEKSKGNEA